jgi:tetratricopeptide (TPR) repeat protein
MADWETEGQPVLDRLEAALRLARESETLQLIQKLMHDFPDRAEGYNKMGVVEAQHKHFAEAQSWFQRALAVNPDYAPAMANLGNLYYERGMYDEALAQYGLALYHDGNSIQAHKGMAAVLRKQGKVRDAVHHLKASDRLAVRGNRAQSSFLPNFSVQPGPRRRFRVEYLYWGIIVVALLYVLSRITHR